MKLQYLAGIALVASLLTATAASATTKVFEYDAGATPVATGSFSYADGSTGVLGYGDLSAFSVTIGADTYTLSDVAGFTDYVHLAYDTAANTFVTGTNLCGFAGCGFNASLSAINSSGNSGFFFEPAPGQFADYANFTPTSFSTFAISSGTPEPATWAMMLIGFGGLGVTMRATRRRAVTSVAA